MQQEEKLERPNINSRSTSASSKSSLNSIPSKLLNANSAMVSTTLPSTRPGPTNMVTPTMPHNAAFDPLTPPLHLMQNDIQRPGITPSNESKNSTDSLKPQVLCKKCAEPISKGQAYELGGDKWHLKCFVCYKCSKNLDCDSDFLVLSSGSLICSNCSESCKVCHSKIDEGAIILSNSNEVYCPACFKCCKCDEKITNLKYAKTKRGFFCLSCHEKLMERRKKYLENRQSKQGSAEDSSGQSQPLWGTHRSKKNLPILPPPRRDKEVQKHRSAITVENTNMTQQYVLPTSVSSLGLALSSSKSSFTSDEHSNSSPKPPVRSPNRSKQIVKQKYVTPMDSPSDFEQYQTAYMNDSSKNDVESVNDSKKLADPINFQNTSMDLLPKTSESSEENGDNDITKTESNTNIPEKPSTIKDTSLDAGFHSRNSSWASSTNAGLNFTPTASSNVKAFQSLKKDSANAEHGFKVPERSHSRKASANSETFTYKAHSRKASIDDILESTLENNADDEKMLLLNRTPLRNSSVVSVLRSPHTVEGPFDAPGSATKNENNSLDPNLQTSTFRSAENEMFVTAPNTGDNNGQNSTHSLQNSIHDLTLPSPARMNAFRFARESDTKNEVQYLGETLQSNRQKSVMSTPKKVGRSLSLKSPKKFFTSLKSHSNNSTPKQLQQPQQSPFSAQHQRQYSNGSNFDSHSGWGVRASNFSISRTPPVPSVDSVRLRTHKKSNSSSSGFPINGRFRPETNNDNNGTINTLEQNNNAQNKPKTGMYSANATNPLSEQTLMDGDIAAIKLQQQLKQYHSGKSKPKGHRKSASASSVMTSDTSRMASGDSVVSKASDDPNPLPNLADFPEFQSGNNTDALSKRNSTYFDNDGGEEEEEEEEEEIKSTSLQLRKLRLELLSMENTKKMLQNDIENLQRQKAKLSSEINELHLSSSRMNSIAESANTEPNYPNKHRFSEISTSSLGNEGNGSSSASAEQGSVSNSIQNSNNNLGNKEVLKPKFWRSIFSGKSNSSSHENNRISRSQSSGSIYQAPNHSEVSLETLERQINSGTSTSIEDGDLSLIQRCEFEKSAVPAVLKYCIEYIEGDVEWLQTEGLYRKSASKTVIESFEEQLYHHILNIPSLSYDQYKSKIDDVISQREDFQDCHVIASVLKRYLRKLPIPVIPFSLYEQFLSVFKQSSNIPKGSSEKFSDTYLLTQVWKNLALLPQEHFIALKAIVHHINIVSQYSNDNLMNLHNLSLVFAPGVIRDYDGSFEISDIKEKNELIEFMAINESKLMVRD
ncbi:hypothetical protein ACO0QE_004589 [Hanseniaspora vineae]